MNLSEKPLQEFMAQNSKYTIKLNKTPSKFEKIPKLHKSFGPEKENLTPNEMPPCNAKSFQRFQQSVSCSDDNFEKLNEDQREKLLETPSEIFNVDRSPKIREIGSKLKEELSKYRSELRNYNNSTKHLEEKYIKINSELNEMKLKHNRLINKRNLPCGDFDTFSDSSSSGTVYSLERKCTQIFDRNKSLNRVPSNEQSLKQNSYEAINTQAENTTNLDFGLPETMGTCRVHHHKSKPDNSKNGYDTGMQNVYMALKTVIDDQTKSHQNADIFSLCKTINKLQSDSERFCSIIEQQKSALSDYRLRFVKAEQLVKEQQFEIEKLHSNNQQLETDAAVAIDQLRHKIENKLKDVDILSNIMRNEQHQRERVAKENCLLNERIRAIQTEANQLKLKLEEMCRRKMSTMSRLKVAERDLKIFKNYNTALKQEKRKLSEEVKSMTDKIESMQSTSKRAVSRHREQSEKQRRDLQKRIFELEMKLNRSQNSTTSLIQERDSLIAELQSQLNNLVHNFEVSQKHIRVLRRHIYSMCGNKSPQSLVLRNRAMADNI